MDKLIFGVAYYDEYMPYERIDTDIKMMQAAGFNTVRVAESTWSTWEKQPGEFDFSTLIRVLDKMEAAGMQVIVGTPTYAIPAWMVKLHPDVLATTKQGEGIYGARQIMDITHPAYRFYAERIIRELMKVTAHRSCVIGFQLDNETKYYDTAGPNVQRAFVNYLKEKFRGDLHAFNQEFGLDYWSNRIDAWEDFPDVRGTINGSLSAEFDKFRRGLVTEFLCWQRKIVDEYRREDQFVTHNFDYEWRGYSFGVQPCVDHFKAAEAVTLAGCDIYHPTQDELTGIEIAFGGDMNRALKKDNYVVLETEAQGFPCWTPYDGQLRLQAYSHLASGANGVSYWHWHSIHNSYETYWKGVLSHDLAENTVYREAAVFGNEIKRIGPSLINLKKHNKVAMLVSNEALSALDNFRIDAVSGDPGKVGYNDIVRWMYDALYKMNVECDFISAEETDLSPYKVILVPALYAAEDACLERLNAWTKAGGTLIVSFKSAFANENVKVACDSTPHILKDPLGVSYNQFTFPKHTELVSDRFMLEDEKAELFMELLMPAGASTLISYKHPSWGKYAAVTENFYGEGIGIYIGCKTSEKVLQEIYRYALEKTGVEIETEYVFPVMIRKGINDAGREIVYYLNYSQDTVEVAVKKGHLLLSDREVEEGERLTIGPWNLEIVEKE